MKKFRTFLLSSMIAAVVAGLALLLIPKSNVRGNGAEKVLSLIIAIIFWIGIIIEIVMLIMANSNRKNSLPANRKHIGTIGALTFFSNREASIVDIILCVSLITLTILTIGNIEVGLLNIIVIVIVFLSFNFHCFFNGKNYKYFKTINKGANRYDKTRKI